MNGGDLEVILKSLLGGCLVIIGYFLKQTANALERLSEKVQLHEVRLAVLENLEEK